MHFFGGKVGCVTGYSWLDCDGDQIQESLKEFVHCRIGAIEQILLITEKNCQRILMKFF